MNGLGTFPLMATSRFCGLPIGLITLPIVTEKANASNSSFGRIPVFLAICNTTGVPIIASVSFIRKADSRPAPNNIRSNRLSAVLARRNSLDER